jgi:hypothetical protein
MPVQAMSRDTSVTVSFLNDDILIKIMMSYLDFVIFVV